MKPKIGPNIILAEKINRLFQEKRKPNGDRYTQTEVVAVSNGALSRVYLWELRKGTAANPGIHVIEFLAEFFEVPVDYFFENEAGPESQKRDELVDRIALRSAQLNEDDKEAVMHMIKSILRTRRKKS